MEKVQARLVSLPPMLPSLLPLPIRKLKPFPSSLPITTMEHIKYWKDKHQHPISKTVVVVSVAPKSEYVKLYKEAIKILVKEKGKPMLFIEDCEFIRSHLPSSHCAVNKEKYAGFEYDHLFIKYFLNNKNYIYAPEYVAYGTDMFLYLHLYKSIKRKQKQHSLTSLSTTSHSSSFEKEDYQTTEDLLRGNIRHLSFTTGELSISKIMKNLCEDIKAVLYLMSSPLTIEQYDRVCKNMKVVQYVYHIYEISAFNKITEDINIHGVRGVRGVHGIHSGDEAIKYIYETIIGIGRIPHFFDFLLNIYRKIELLYRYCFPFYYIYNKSNNCKKNRCSISLEDFTDDYALDKGDVSILPYFKGTKLKDNEYSCYLTEELYKWIESKRGESFDIKSFEVRNPRTNEVLTLYDIIYVYKNKVRLIERAIEKDGFSATLTSERNDINNIIEKLIKYNKAAKEQFEKLEEQAYNENKKGFEGLFTFSQSDNGSRYLNLHLGNEVKSLPNIAESDILNERLKTFRGGKKIKYILNGEKVSLLHNHKRLQRSIYVKENGKAKYCKINKEYILLSKLKKQKHSKTITT